MGNRNCQRKKESERTEVRESNQSIKTGRHAHRYRNIEIKPQKNITIYSTKDGYAFDNTINSKVLCFAFGLVAEIERNLISMRTKEALALRKAEGVILGRKKGSITKLKILIDNELEIIDRLKKGESMASICRIYGVSTDTFSKFRKVCPSVEEAFQYKMTHFYTSSK